MSHSVNALTITLLVLGLLACHAAHGSAIKGHLQQPVQQQQQNLDLARKAPVHQQPERSPKSAPVAQQPVVTPILESSKKVYNDESIRRSAQQQQQVIEQAPAAALKSAPVVAESAPVAVPVVNVAPVQPVVPQQQPVVAAPVVAEQPAAVVAKAPVEQPAAIIKPDVPLTERHMEEKPVVEPVVKVAAPVDPEERAPVPVVPVVPVVPQSQQAPIVAPVQPQVQPVVPAAQLAQPEPIVQSKPIAPSVVVPVDSPLQAKKDEPAAPVAKDAAEPIEVPAPDPGLVLSEPIDSTTKLLIDLDEHVQKFLPAEDKQESAKPDKEHVLVSGIDYSPPAAAAAAAGETVPSGKSSVPLPVSYLNVENEPIVPPLPSSLEKVEKASGAQAAPSQPASGQSATRQANHQHQNQQQVITQLLDQLDSLQNRIQDTINQLVARRRYVMSALLRPMGTYVRRVRTNLERLQNRVNQLQAAASSVGGSQNGQNRPGGFVDAAAIETIRRRIDDISKRISDIVNRIRFSLTPTSAPLNSNGRK